MVRSLRSTLHSHVWLAALMVLAALLLRIAVPAGFMPAMGAHGLTLVPCSGTGPMEPVSAPVAHPATHGMHDPGAHRHHTASAPTAAVAQAGHEDGAQAQSGCAFAELATPALPGADPIQLAAALLFLGAAALFFPAARPRRAASWLRPPLRGPPFLA